MEWIRNEEIGLECNGSHGQERRVLVGTGLAVVDWTIETRWVDVRSGKAQQGSYG